MTSNGRPRPSLQLVSDAGSAGPSLLAEAAFGRPLLGPGEIVCGEWVGRGAWTERQAVAAPGPEGHAHWEGTGRPVLTLTDRRLLLHAAGPAAGQAAQLGLQRLVRVSAQLHRVSATVIVEALAHHGHRGEAMHLRLGLAVRRRQAVSVVRHVARAHRAWWHRVDLPPALAAALADGRLRPTGRGLVYEAAAHVPLGLDDAIRGPAAGPSLPQRVRLDWPAPAPRLELLAPAG